MNNPEDVPFGGCSFGDPFSVDMGSEPRHCFRDLAETQHCWPTSGSLGQCDSTVKSVDFDLFLLLHCMG